MTSSREPHLEEDLGTVYVAKPGHESLIHKHQAYGLFTLSNAAPQPVAVRILSQGIGPQTLHLAPTQRQWWA